VTALLALTHLVILRPATNEGYEVILAITPEHVPGWPTSEKRLMA
jgi:hypothetical protein